MDSELSKIQWLELLENTLVTRETSYCMEVIAKNYNALYSYLNSDENFKNSFLTLCLKVSNINALMYVFLASYDLVSGKRPCTWNTIANHVHLITSTKREHQDCIGFLTKVIILLFILISVAKSESLDFQIEKDENCILITSSVATVQYKEMTEQYDLNTYYDQMSLIDSSLTTIKQLMYFSKENAQCQTIGSANANPDHLEKMIQLVRMKNISAVKLNIFEQSEQHFTAYLQNRNNTIGCIISNSLNYLQFLLAQNPFRTTPTTDSSLTRYRHKMLELFQNQNRCECLRHSRPKMSQSTLRSLKSVANSVFSGIKTL